MFIGHFAVGFASKRFAPRTSFALLLTAPLLSDILWPVLLLLGRLVEQSTPRLCPLPDQAYASSALQQLAKTQNVAVQLSQLSRPNIFSG